MNIIFKALWWIFTRGILFFVLLPFIFAFMVEAFDRFTSTDFGARQYLKGTHEIVEIKRTESGIRYAEIGEKEKPALIFIHGGTGGLRHGQYLAKNSSVYDDFRLILVERSGYGGTGGPIEPSIIKQAEMISEIIQNELQHTYVIGISYGAPVAMELAYQNKENVAFVLGTSGAYYADLEPDLEFTNRIPWVVRFFFPRILRRSLAEYDTHKNALNDIQSHYNDIQSDVFLWHGGNDSLISQKNSIRFATEVLKDANKLLILPNMGHRLHVLDHLIVQTFRQALRNH